MLTILSEQKTLWEDVIKNTEQLSKAQLRMRGSQTSTMFSNRFLERNKIPVFLCSHWTGTT